MAGSGSPLGINERKEIKRLIGKMSLTKIAERLNRSKNCIITEVRNNGGQENYDPVKAHQRATDVQKEGRERTEALHNLRLRTQDAEYLIRQLREGIQKNDDLRQHLEDQIRQVKGMNVLLPMIQKLDEKYVNLTERLEIVSNVKPLYIEKMIKKVNAMEKKFNGFLERFSPPVKGESAPKVGRLINASEWHKYHDWPLLHDIMRFIRERDTNGFNHVCFKPDKKWIIDEDKYLVWIEQYKEKLLAKSTKVEVT